MEYNHENKSDFTLLECNAAIGRRATLPLTGEIVEAGESEFGPYVKFLIDERWGYGEWQLVTDLDALQIEKE